MQVYNGKSPGEAPEKNQGMRAILDVTVELNGHNITSDYFFSSYTLVEELLKKKGGMFYLKVYLGI